MKVKIKAIKGRISQGIEVEFESQFGQALGIWAAGDVQVDRIYDVEFDIPTALRWGDEVTRLLDHQIPLNSDDSTFYLWGKVEDIIGDQITLRVGDSLLLIEVPSHAAIIDDLLEVKASQILLYDQNF